MFLILLGFLQIVAPSDSTLIQQSRKQAEYYIHQINSGRNIEENLWALSIVSTSNKNVKAFAEREIKRDKNGGNELLSIFTDIKPSFQDQLKKVVFKTGSRNLLIALLLSTPDKKREEIYKQFRSNFDFPQNFELKYNKLCQSIINKRNITADILPVRTFLLPHFFLLYYNQQNRLLTEKYLEKLSTNWKSNQEIPNNLSTDLYEITLLRVNYLLNRYSQTSQIYNDLIQDRLFPNSSIKLRTYRYLDYSMYRLGYFDRNLEIARKYTLPLSKYLGERSIELGIKFTYGINLYSIGKIKEAEKIYQEVLNNINTKNPEVRLSSLYNNLALAQYKLGKYDQYLDLQLQALKIAKQQHNYAHRIEILNNLFIYYRKSKNSRKAINYLEQAKNLALKEGSNSDLGKIYTYFGSFYRKFEQNMDKAFRYYAKAKKVLDIKNNTRIYIKLLVEEAETHKKDHNYQKALEKYDKILQITPQKTNPDHIDALVNKALVYLKINNLNKANKYIYKFKSYDLSKLDFEQIVKAKTVEANYLNKTGNPHKALDLLTTTLDQIVERARSSADLKSGFWHVADEYLDAFDLAVSIDIETNQPGKAVELLDQLKTINDASLYQNPLVKSSLLNESELTQYKKLSAQLDATRKKLLTAHKSQQFDIRQTITQLKLKKKKLDKKLTNHTEKNPPSVRDIQNRLSAHQLVIHMTELKDKYYIANISRSGVDIHTIKLNPGLRELFSHSIEEVSTHKTNLDSLYAITKLLGLENLPDQYNQITIIPDSYFYQLPIDILPLDKPDHRYSYGEVTYLIEKYQTHYLTSLADFKNKNSSPRLKNKMSFAGYGVSNFSGYRNKSLVPLPFAQKEVKSIASKLTHLSKVHTYLNSASTKQTFTQTAPQAQIIHLATHSQVSERDPMFSTIYMSDPAGTTDSTFNDQIFAYELFELNLNNQMIMLNSCESGSGPYIQGTGVMGISRALQYAGANSLILNLWSVNDMMASDFAVYFYEQLNEGKSKAEALRNTKRYFLRTKNASPHYWGPYMLIGNSNPIITPNKKYNLAMAGAFIGYFLLMVALSLLKQQGIIFRDKSQAKRAA